MIVVILASKRHPVEAAFSMVKPHSVLLPLVDGTSQALIKGKLHQLFKLPATHIPHVSLLVLIFQPSHALLTSSLCHLSVDILST